MGLLARRRGFPQETTATLVFGAWKNFPFGSMFQHVLKEDFVLQ